jgi:hypothetical protein
MNSVYFHMRHGMLSNALSIRKAFEDLKEGAYELRIIRRNKRSIPQNRFYWGVCVRLVHDGLKDLGHDISLEETHDFLKAKFNYTEIVNEATGEVERIPRSTTEMNKSDFAVYVEKIQQFAAEFLNVQIPNPGEQLAIEYE